MNLFDLPLGERLARGRGEPGSGPGLRTISLGGGVQSTVMALLAARGEFGPPPDAAIFADTGWEPSNVYENIEWLRSVLPFPVVKVSNERTLLEDCESLQKVNGYPGLAPPIFIKGKGKPAGMGWRQCTRDYKIIPIRRHLRKMLGAGSRARIPPGFVEQWLGISLDEVGRMGRSRDKWIALRYPLVDDGWNRGACAQWFRREYPGRHLGKSACVGCPYHSAREWVTMRAQDPAMWKRTVALDAKIRHMREHAAEAGITAGEAYLHRRCLPLDEAVNLDEARLRGQPKLFDESGGWGNECGGHCGV